ncbi:hypothetical protein DAPPUDRAFT_102736 [Daphnia pulex]|uniref:Uncharacterized protein n=1 Tax=Daphnia pulex TaxID=6669 RepID=E9GHC7_DAPPU|nr:hypothetical protein DAPPUDRAFT_102736 [Daphnia pulex]|eukprot:EFX81202.1 hypothetical protein DAPPUDRAFT_102736 [Daphnia pulex]
MANSKLTKCVICIERQNKEDNLRIQPIGRRVFYSFQNREEEEERNVFICNRCHFFKEERTHDSDFSALHQSPGLYDNRAAKKWTSEQTGTCWRFRKSCQQKTARNRISRSSTERRHLLASNITIQPGERHEEAQGHTNPNQKDGKNHPTVEPRERFRKQIVTQTDWDSNDESDIESIGENNTVDPEETEPALDFNTPVINIPSNDISVELNDDVDIPLFNQDEIEFDNPPVNTPHPRHNY